MVSGEFRYMMTDINPELVVLNLNGKVGKHLDVGGFHSTYRETRNPPANQTSEC